MLQSLRCSKNYFTGSSQASTRSGRTTTALRLGTKILVICSFLALPASADAAIAFDNSNSVTDGVNQSTLTYSLTVGSGSNRLLVVGVSGSNLSDTLTGVTYAGSAMTFIGKLQVPGDRWIYEYYQLAPTSGTNNVVVSLSASTNVGSSAVSYTGVAQTGQPDVSTTNTISSATSITTTVTTVTNNDWCVTFSKNNQATMVAGTNSTVRSSVNSSFNIFDTNGAVTPAGSFSMTQTWSPSGNAGGVMACFSPAASAAAVVKIPDPIFWGWW